MRYLRKLVGTSLASRVLALTVVLAVAAGVAVGGLLLLTLRDMSLRQTQLRSVSAAKSAAIRAQFALLVGDREELNRTAQEILSSDDVLFVVITDREGMSVRAAKAGVPDSVFPSIPTASPANRNRSDGSAERRTIGAFDFIESEHMVQPPDSNELLDRDTNHAPSPPIGAVRIGISLAEVKATSFKAAAEALALSFAALALIMWIEFTELRNIMRPLGKLADFTSSVREGNLEQRARVGGPDEVAALASAFNAMLDRLASTLVSKDLAEQASQAKSRFLATTGHELRTPMNAIIGYTELLEEECADRGLDDLLPDLRKVRDAGGLLLELMNELLDFSKAEAGRMKLDFQPVTVAMVIDEVLSTVEPMARKNGNRLVKEEIDEDLSVWADHGRFRQSLLNLASNACKFTANGTVTFAAGRGPGAACGIHVRDTGIGIVAQDLSKLFEPFVQLDSTAARKFEGTGLGLAISRRFCRMMGGDITVESEPGLGSVFSIHLPASQVHEAADLAETKQEAECNRDPRGASL